MKNASTENPHRRYNILTGEWVLVSPHRTQRPWQGKKEKSTIEAKPEYDAGCYLCPGNTRANGNINPDYKTTFVFPNDFSALLPNQTEKRKPENKNKLFISENVWGECRVICFSPKHNLTLAEMSLSDINNVVNVWIKQFAELGNKYSWVQIFENRGEIMGSSNQHPHGQIWAGSFLPNEIVKENKNQKKYFEDTNNYLLIDYLNEELKSNERIIAKNEHWVVLIPYWAIWPFETLLLPRRNMQYLTELSEEEKTALAKILKEILIRYDNLFNTSFPYTFGWHNAPTDNSNYNHWQLHAHFYPPLLRSATVKKFMVGYEMLAEAQRDITPEAAAAMLKNVSEIHYKEKL